MDVIIFILACCASIAAMTAFSSLWSSIARVEFREYVLLSEVLTKDPVRVPEKRFQLGLGWLIHIVMGVIFIGLYELLWRLFETERHVLWALIFGSAIGVLGILGWSILFKIRPDRVKINVVHFYIHLYFAHLVFSLAALFIYKLFNS